MRTLPSPSVSRQTWIEVQQDYQMDGKSIPGNEFQRCLEGLVAQGIIPRREVKGKVQYGFSPKMLPQVYAALGK